MNIKNIQSILIFLFALSMQVLHAQKPVDTRPQEKEVMLEKLFIEATREKILGNRDDAIGKYLEVLQKDPKNHMAAYELATLYKALDKFDKAFEYSGAAVELDKKSILYTDFFVSLLEKKGEYVQSAGLYAKLIEIYPDNQRLYYSAAYLWHKADDKEQALKVYNALEKRIGINPDLFASKYKLYINMGKDKKALQELQALIDKYPKEAAYPLQMAEYYKKNNKTDEARKYFEKALQVEPGNTLANIAMADIFLQERDTIRYLNALIAVFDDPQQSPEAKLKALEPLADAVLKQKDSNMETQVFELAQKLITFNPDFSAGFLPYGNLLMLEGRYADAIKAYENVLSTDKSKPEPWTLIAEACMKAGEGKKLLSKTKDFVELFPDQAQSQYYRGLALNSIGDYTAAQKMLKRASDMSLGDEKLNARVKSAQAENFYGLADKAKADAAFANAVKYTEDPEVSMNLCNALLTGASELGKAEEMLNRISKDDPKNVCFQSMHARLLFRKGKFSEAKQQCEKAMNAGALNDPKTLELYGDIHYRLNDTDAALLHWKQAAEAGMSSEVLKRKIEIRKLD
jgi:tetratricopeptide (TPR) repeat protein